MEIFDKLNSIYKEALHLNPNATFPDKSSLVAITSRDIAESSIQYVVTESGVVLPTMDVKDYLDAFHQYQYSFFDDYSNMLINPPIKEVW